MNAQARSALIKIHAAIAAFCLPVGIMFLITGGLYTAGIKGATTKEVYNIPLSSPVVPSKENLLQLARHELDSRGIDYPTGKIHYREKKARKILKWGDLNRRLRIESTDNPRLVTLTIKTPGWFQRFMSLHKADGKTPFRIYAMVWATLLLILFITGVVMAWQVKKLRALVIRSALSGSIIFMALLFHSLWYT